MRVSKERKQEAEGLRQVETFEQSSRSLKKELTKPTPIPAHKAPKGNGNTKGDMLMQRLAVEFRYDPIQELIKLAKNDKTSSELKFKVACQLADYYLPKVKAIDTNPNQGEVISINVLMPN